MISSVENTGMEGHSQSREQSNDSSWSWTQSPLNCLGCWQEFVGWRIQQVVCNYRMVFIGFIWITRQQKCARLILLDCNVSRRETLEIFRMFYTSGILYTWMKMGKTVQTCLNMVQTCLYTLMHVHKFMNVYRHVYEYIEMYIACTYTFMIIYICIYMVHTRS